MILCLRIAYDKIDLLQNIIKNKISSCRGEPFFSMSGPEILDPGNQQSLVTNIFRQHAASIYGFVRQFVCQKKVRPLLSKVRC